MRSFSLLTTTFCIVTFTTVNCCNSCRVEITCTLINGMAVFTGTYAGKVKFTYIPDSGSYTLSGQVSGYAANSEHGVHIHQFGNLGGNCADAGSHYTFLPELFNKHGGPTSAERHDGDLGNFLADAGGNINFALTIKTSLLGYCNEIIGRALVIHANKDDLGLGGNADSLTTGNSGARLTCAVIGISQ